MSSSNNRIIKAGIGYTVGNLLIKGIVFLSTPLFTRLMSPEDFGLVGAYLAYESIIIVFTSLMLHASVKNAYYEFNSKIYSYISNVILISIITTLPILLISIVFSKYLQIFTNLSQLEMILLILNSFGITILNIYNSFISMRYKYKRFILIAFLNSIFNIIISVLLMLTFLENDRSLARILGYSLPIIIIAVVIVVSSFIKAMPKIEKNQVKFALLYSLPLLPLGIADVILAQSDRIMIQYYVGNTSLGYYTLAYSIYAIIAIVRNSLDLVWTPWSYEKLNSKKYSALNEKSTLYIDAVFLLSVSILIFVNEIIYILGGVNYYDAIYSAIPLIIASFIILLNSLPLQVIYYSKKNTAIAISYSIAAFVNIVLNFIFIPKFGYIAAGYTTLASYALLLSLNCLIVDKYIKLALFNYRYFLWSVLIIILIALLPLYYPNLILKLIIWFTIFSILYIKYREKLKIKDLLELLKKEKKL